MSMTHVIDRMTYHPTRSVEGGPSQIQMSTSSSSSQRLKVVAITQRGRRVRGLDLPMNLNLMPLLLVRQQLDVGPPCQLFSKKQLAIR